MSRRKSPDPMYVPLLVGCNLGLSLHREALKIFLCTKSPTSR